MAKSSLYMFFTQIGCLEEGQGAGAGPAYAVVDPWRLKNGNSIAHRQDTSKREGAQSIDQLASHEVIQKTPIPPPTAK